MDNTQSKDSQSFDDAMRKIWGPTWGKFRDINGKDNFQKRTAPDMNNGQASKELQSEIAALKKLLNDIFVSLQSANEKFTKISEAITSGSSSSVENNRNNNSISKREKKPATAKPTTNHTSACLTVIAAMEKKILKKKGFATELFPSRREITTASGKEKITIATAKAKTNHTSAGVAVVAAMRKKI